MTLNRRAVVTCVFSLMAIAKRSAAQDRRPRAVGLLAVDAPGSDTFQRLFRSDMTALGLVEGRDVRDPVRTVLLDHDEPGFWESNGYHRRGDPWKEERYWTD